MKSRAGWVKRLLIWLRQLVDPLWIPPEEMERARKEMLERVEMDKRAREGKEGQGSHAENPD